MRIFPILTLALVLVAGLLIAPTGTEARGQRAAVPLRGKQRALVEVGRRLFFEPVLSRTGRRSCASCHDPEHGFSDPSPFSDDDIGRTLRHSQTIIDSAFNPSAHWDGEFSSIETLVTARVGLPQGARGGGGYGRSPGHSTLDPEEFEPEDDDPSDDEDTRGSPVITPRDPDLERKLGQLERGQDVVEDHGRYAEAMKDAFGDASVSRARVARAIAAYCRSVFHTESAYDRWRAGDPTALSASAKRGLSLFKGRAGCAQCHTLAPYSRHAKVPAGRRAAFTDRSFHNTGLAWREMKQEAQIGADIKSVRGFVFADPGRGRLTKTSMGRHAFKTPSLRDVTRRPPYMHNASFTTLEEVVRYYATGGTKDPDQDRLIRPFRVSDDEVADLVAFLGSLESGTRPGLADTPYRARAASTRVRLVDADGEPLCGLPVRLLPAGDRLPAEKAWSMDAVPTTSDAKGWFEFGPGAHTHTRLVLPGGIVPMGGELIPDSCARAIVKMPVRGHVTVAVLVNKGRTLPETIYAEHVGGLRFEGHDAPRTELVRTHVLEASDHRILRYRGWMRTDVPATVAFDLPGGKTDAAKPLKLDAKRTLELDLRRSRSTE